MSDFNVMLAHPYGKKAFDKDSFIQPKLDGVRCYITKDGAFSRNHKEFKTVDHIKDLFKPIFELAPDIILDGELYNHQFKDNFNKIISLVRKQKLTDEDKAEAKKYIQFHWYDFYNPNDKFATYRRRHQLIKQNVIELQFIKSQNFQSHLLKRTKYPYLIQLNYGMITILKLVTKAV